MYVLKKDRKEITTSKPDCKGILDKLTGYYDISIPQR